MDSKPDITASQQLQQSQPRPPQPQPLIQQRPQFQPQQPLQGQPQQYTRPPLGPPNNPNVVGQRPLHPYTGEGPIRGPPPLQRLDSRSGLLPQAQQQFQQQQRPLQQPPAPYQQVQQRPLGPTGPQFQPPKLDPNQNQPISIQNRGPAPQQQLPPQQNRPTAPSQAGFQQQGPHQRPPFNRPPGPFGPPQGVPTAQNPSQGPPGQYRAQPPYQAHENLDSVLRPQLQPQPIQKLAPQTEEKPKMASELGQPLEKPPSAIFNRPGSDDVDDVVVRPLSSSTFNNGLKYESQAESKIQPPEINSAAKPPYSQTPPPAQPPKQSGSPTDLNRSSTPSSIPKPQQADPVVKKTEEKPKASEPTLTARPPSAIPSRAPPSPAPTQAPPKRSPSGDSARESKKIDNDREKSQSRASSHKSQEDIMQRSSSRTRMKQLLEKPAEPPKKVSMNKVQVGFAPPPNLRQVRSKIGSLDNAAHKPGGGKIKIETKKLEFNAGSRIEAKNDKYAPKGGEKKIISTKLQWNAKSKIGSLDNANHKPGGGDKRILTIKTDFREKAQPKVGSKDHSNGTAANNASDADAAAAPSQPAAQPITKA